MKGNRLKKKIISFSVSIVIIFAVILIIASPLAKYLIEKKGSSLTGRKVKLSWIYANPFTGHAHIKNLRIFEAGADSLFFATDVLDIDFKIIKLFRKKVDISSLTLINPFIRIIQNKKTSNFDDIISKLSHNQADSSLPDTTASNGISIRKIKINNGEFHYAEKSIPINYYIKNVSIESPGLLPDTDTMAFKFSFHSGPSTGFIEGNGSVNIKSHNYSVAISAKNFDLQLIKQYMLGMASYGNFSAKLDADVRSKGNIDDKGKMEISGLLSISDFHLGKSPGNDFLSFSKLVSRIKDINPGEFQYVIDSISVTKPYFRYERYDHLDNLQRMFGEGGSGIKEANAHQNSRFNLIIELANDLKLMSRNFFRSRYKIGHIAIYDGNLQFNDFSLNEKFSIAAKPFDFRVDSVSKSRKRVDLSLKTNVIPYGKTSINISLNPNDTGEFDMSYHLNKIPLTLFNPYVITYTSYPLDRGTLDLNGDWKVRNSRIKSNNHLILTGPHLAVRLKRKESKRLPLPLILSFVRERNNLIDYEIPITGDLRNPKFNLWDVVTDLLGNIFLKPPSIPYLAHTRQVEDELEKFLSVVWMTKQAKIYPVQKEFLKEMNDFLKKNQDAAISVTPVEFESKEKEYILFYEAKKRYYLATHNLDIQSYNREDSSKVDKMSARDSSFVHFLNDQIGDTLFTIEEKCQNYIAKTIPEDSSSHKEVYRKIIDQQYRHLQEAREQVFLSFFSDPDVRNRVKIEKATYVIPFNGFSFFKIDYKGDMPKKLRKAYIDMNDLTK